MILSFSAGKKGNAEPPISSSSSRAESARTPILPGLPFSQGFHEVWYRYSVKSSSVENKKIAAALLVKRTKSTPSHEWYVDTIKDLFSRIRHEMLNQLKNNLSTTITLMDEFTRSLFSQNLTPSSHFFLKMKKVLKEPI